MDWLISVVIPVRNEAQRLPALLDDLQALRQGGHEVVVVDGGSSDGTVALAAESADRVVESTPGRAAQMNKGARKARGTVLWFLHADVRVQRGAERAIRDAVRAGHEWGRFDVHLDAPGRAFRVIEWFMNRRSRMTGIATGDQGLFVSRRLFNKVEGYPEIPLMEDIALSRSLREYQWPACVRPPLHVSARKWQEQGTAQTVLLMWRLRLAYYFGADPAELHRKYYGH